jgi:general stress protein CsbA
MSRVFARNTRWALMFVFWMVVASAGLTFDRWQWWVAVILLGLIASMAEIEGAAQ